MKWSSSLLLLSVAAVGMLCIPRVAAASGSAGVLGGRMTFTGAIVEPTCAVQAASVETLVARSSVQHRLNRVTCAGPDIAAITPQIYSLSVVRLSSLEADRVLKYFETYVKASRPDAAEPVLLTETYE
jgi:hypothetical protein